MATLMSTHPISPFTLKNAGSGKNNGRSKQYRKIRWREYDPSSKAGASEADPFVLWKPPVDEAAVVNQPKPRKSNVKYRKALVSKSEGKSSPLSSAFTTPSPMEPLPCNATRANPFVKLPIKRTDCVDSTLDYFITICHGLPSNDANAPARVNPHLSMLLPFAYQHTLLFESLIAVCRASVLISLGRSAFDDKAFIHHRGEAMAGLNARLSSDCSTDDAALLTATMLMTLEYLIGNNKGVIMHSQGLEQMLRIRGRRPVDDDPDLQSEQWATFVEDGLTAYKALGSFVTGVAPELPHSSAGFAGETFEKLDLLKPLSYPQKPFSEKMQIIIGRLPPGASAFCLTSEVSEQMVNLLASIDAAAQSALRISEESRPLDLVSLANVRIAENDHIRQQMTTQNLLSALQRMTLMNPRAQERYLCFGLVAFLHQLRRMAPLNLFLDPLLRSFITILPHHTKPSTQEEQHALLWASVSVAGIMALRISPMPGAHTIMDHALELYPEAREWSQLETILKSFFWTQKIGEHWHEVWKAATKRMEKLMQQKKVAADASSELELSSRLSDTWLRQHMRGAPREMMEMGQALGMCPFRPRQ